MTFWPAAPKPTYSYCYSFHTTITNQDKRVINRAARLMTAHALKDHIKIDKLLQMADIDTIMGRVRVTVLTALFLSVCHNVHMEVGSTSPGKIPATKHAASDSSLQYGAGQVQQTGFKWKQNLWLHKKQEVSDHRHLKPAFSTFLNFQYHIFFKVLFSPTCLPLATAT